MHSTHDEVDLRLRIVRRSAVADGVVALDLQDPSGAALPVWSPGAHVDVALGPDLVRQYSLCGDPADRSTWRVAVLRETEGRGGSQYVHDKLAEGDVVDVRGPRNHFALEPAARYVFIAGGIGITPLLPMMAAATASGAEWELHYGGRTSASMAFRAELTAAHGPRVVFRPQDEHGLLDLDAILGPPRADTLVYCCGPEPLLRAVEERCASWPSGTLHVERFAPKEQGEPVRHESFEVELAQSGKTLTVPPDQSILDVADAAGVFVLFSCREGTCGTCETPVLDGAVDHRDSLLTAEERAANDTMFICVSRAACPKLVLDL
ncbi:PDR/VanB family oxidoreductase [Cryptosporangium aurantiacum]|uniref:Ferredoxin-NADP reductase n=1 Tax=Cryptosporangium aurantiacum TaxID=134849 RepID=A0A1M7RA83_9ACTN|nr:PDR/VanB family oxidoreductase [Cryptosporangium aurantiacum]SHN43237.1 Ferredoxin-NADP reductase [Cryptosporangium aurantiacum]